MLVDLVQGNENLQEFAVLTIVDEIIKDLPIFDPSYGKCFCKRSDSITNGSILKATSLMQSLSMTNYHDIQDLNSNTIFSDILGVNISPETLRQRLDKIAKIDGINDDIDDAIVEILKKAPLKTDIFGGKEYYLLDIDVTPFINPGVKKEGISYTYKGAFGYAPIMAYFGHYAISFDLRPGSQHSEKGAVEFLDRCLRMIQNLDIDMSKILIRVDSGHDASEFIKKCNESNCKFIIARNLRSEKKKEVEYVQYLKGNKDTKPIYSEDNDRVKIYRGIVYGKKPSAYNHEDVRCICEVNEYFRDEHGSFYFDEDDPSSSMFGCEPWKKYEVKCYWTNIDIFDENGEKCTNETKYVGECISIYRDHATSEQYHSEVKTDMDLELLPSKYFVTNKLFLQLAAIAFNVIRMIGDKALDEDDRLQSNKLEKKDRIRFSTIVKKIINIPVRIVKHAQKTTYKFGKYCKFFALFKLLYSFFQC